VYSPDLAYIHDVGFGAFARRAGPHIAAILRRHGIRGGLVVEAGCGSGDLARFLSTHGYSVRGFDVSPAMVRLARERAPAGAFRVASLATMRLPACAAIVAIGEVITYVPGGLPVVRRFFRRAYAALRPGGVLVFDFIASARGRTYPQKTLRGRDWQIAVSASFDATTRILTRRMTMRRRVGRRVRSSRETHRVRVYTRPAILAALRACGFEAAAAPALARLPLMRGDAAVVARKPAHV
jgi:SAM-dependent methyltransferase